MIRQETVNNLQLVLAMLGILHTRGDFKPMEPSPRAGAWKYGASSTSEMQDLYEIMYKQQLKGKAETGDGMSDELLSQHLQLGLTALGTLLAAGKFRPSEPNLKTGGARYGASETDTRKIFIMVLHELTEATKVVSAPSRGNPPPAHFE